MLVVLSATPSLASKTDLPKILIYGDSLSAGYRLASNEGFAPQLKKALALKGIKVKMFNASQSGETTKGGLTRLSWALKNLPPPNLVILELGANDALRALNPDSAHINLEKMISILKTKKAEILLAGMLAPPNLGDNYGKKFNGLYPALAKKHNIILYPFFLDGVAGNNELNLLDGIHPNAKGVKQIVSNILPFVIKSLKRSYTKNKGSKNGISQTR